jgi:hypothetical protein
MIKLILTFILGFIIGRIYSYYKNRIQCVHCGSFKTSIGAAGYGPVKGSDCKIAVKHWVAYTCNKCGKDTSIQMSVI